MTEIAQVDSQMERSLALHVPFAVHRARAARYEGEIAERLVSNERTAGHRPYLPVNPVGKAADEGRTEKFLRLYHSDLPGYEIGKQMNIGKSRMRQMCQDLGLPPMSFRPAAKPGRKRGQPANLAVPDDVWIDLARRNLFLADAARQAGASPASAIRAEERLGISFRRKRINW